ncbi:hypothetical protein [Nocardia iowensis]|uniref:Secreted protein n=1 Tax=Nocardia iowensis TaxID=204891 RepID=A0ABX8S0U4_NOCIO|nr:hypothetical protein [Nocardia iowensis]QXN94250.1 hypothetical protein KV110_15030 [Nocardia iowensis]
MRHTLRTTLRVGTGTAVVAAAIVAGLGPASAQIPLEAHTAAEPAPVAGPQYCLDTNPMNPGINLAACLASLSASISGAKTGG